MVHSKVLCIITVKICSAGSRVFVHRKHYETVVDALVKMANNVKLGAGMEKGTEMGPLVSKKQQERVLHYIEQGKKEGATVMGWW